MKSRPALTFGSMYEVKLLFKEDVAVHKDKMMLFEPELFLLCCTIVCSME